MSTGPGDSLNDRMRISVDGFGYLHDKVTGTSELVKRYTWTNENKLIVQVITYGATITVIKTPDYLGNQEDVVLGYDNMDGYITANNPYFGATVGRVCNRIAESTFELNGNSYHLDKNLFDRHHLHGGFKALDKFVWESHIVGNKVVMSYLSKDGANGYPGNLLVSATFEVTADNKLILDYMATSDKPTPVNLTSHGYFNLAGHAAGPTELRKHVVSINADKITEVNYDYIPTGKLLNVAGTEFDLRIPQELDKSLKNTSDDSFDHNFVVSKGSEQNVTFVSRVVHPESGRVMEIYSDQPGVQFYTGNSLPLAAGSTNSPNPAEICGKAGAKYIRHGALCLETQKFPDAVHHPNFASVILIPGQIYTHRVVYKFGVQKS